jgi:hypothetical protein
MDVGDAPIVARDGDLGSDGFLAGEVVGEGGGGEEEEGREGGGADSGYSSGSVVKSRG